jgi:hypothetical protein
LKYQARRARLRTVVHDRHAKPFDQGDLGSCTGNAAAGLLVTEPFFEPWRRLSLRDVVGLYRRAIEVDSIEGAYPPDDAGSSGLAVMKAAKEFGLIKRYTHAFGLDHALKALAYAPVITCVNWYEASTDPTTPVG